jgi:hypothetical protein
VASDLGPGWYQHFIAFEDLPQNFSFFALNKFLVGLTKILKEVIVGSDVILAGNTVKVLEHLLMKEKVLRDIFVQQQIIAEKQVVIVREVGLKNAEAEATLPDLLKHKIAALSSESDVDLIDDAKSCGRI